MSKTFSVRLSDSDAAAVQAQAERAGSTPAAVIRDAIRAALSDQQHADQLAALEQRLAAEVRSLRDALLTALDEAA